MYDKPTSYLFGQQQLMHSNLPTQFSSVFLNIRQDMLRPKRRRTSNSKTVDTHPESVDQSFPLPQHSSPSKSDCEKMIRTKSHQSSSSPRAHPLFRQKISSHNHALLNLSSNTSRTCGDIRLSPDDSNKKKQELVTVVCNDHACEVQCKAVESSSSETPKTRNLIGAEVRGQVDGAFDSGYLMTAIVNGMVYRGILFPPGPDLVSKGAVLGRCRSSFVHHTTDNHGVPGKNLSSFSLPRHSQPHAKAVDPGPVPASKEPCQGDRPPKIEHLHLQDKVLG